MKTYFLTIALLGLALTRLASGRPQPSEPGSTSQVDSSVLVDDELFEGNAPFDVIENQESGVSNQNTILATPELLGFPQELFNNITYRVSWDGFLAMADTGAKGQEMVLQSPWMRALMGPMYEFEASFVKKGGKFSAAIFQKLIPMEIASAVLREDISDDYQRVEQALNAAQVKLIKLARKSETILFACDWEFLQLLIMGFGDSTLVKLPTVRAYLGKNCRAWAQLLGLHVAVAKFPNKGPLAETPKKCFVI
ncbi:hypothetical protein BJ085DRAFT_28751 [Dimargaris cristalligena]|uniref:Uncharacterized protein n=1 Tax=Dimargaris cristalligena TaxID=215637 RepID=A0A4P9ZUB5_9FUNG|nr:hypothetical protein BJ085DRAFT_28751 [Dimargaris cristalligena]|eukprot:RKP36180.1 hypothetical protein BJ085DRAFT_28751 [Dimargaris cristalligena]